MKIRYPLIALSILLGSVTLAQAQVDINVQLPGVSIGLDMQSYPDLVQVPDYPVYYNPTVNSNYFFYDGLFWVYEGDNWYSSSWYNGPWELTQPEFVPMYVLRVPVRYYRRPPVYFRGWVYDAPPRWGDHWGRDWEFRHRGWDHWDRRAIPQAAPLPIYQRQYYGNRYPRVVEQQHTILVQNYRYQPHEAITQQRFQAPRPQNQRDQRVDPNPRSDQMQRGSQPQRIEQNQRNDQQQRFEQNQRNEQNQRDEQQRRVEQNQRNDQNQRNEQQQRVEQQRRAEQNQRSELQQRADQQQRSEQQQRIEQQQRAEIQQHEQQRNQQQLRSPQQLQTQPQAIRPVQPPQPAQVPQTAAPVQVQRPQVTEPPRENKSEKRPENERGRENRGGDRDPDRR